MKRKLTFAASVVGGILVADIISKRWALEALAHGGTVDGLFGVPLTLAFNTGIAFGLDVPEAGRWILIVASVLVVVMLAVMFRHARPDDWALLSSLSLVAAGALGNLIDRVRWERGVVDFIGPIDLGFMLWPIFNVADMAITIGACLLALTMWKQEAEQPPPAAGTAEVAAGEPQTDLLRRDGMIEVGKKAPAFTLPDQDGNEVKLSGFRGRKVVLYFYPKDNTSGCTTQACGLRDRIEEFDARGAEILGISPDSPKSHTKFREKFDLPFTLLADTEHTVAEKYGVWKEKSMYGRKYWGIVRTTFVIDADGRLEQILPKVKPAGHAEQVLDLL